MIMVWFLIWELSYGDDKDHDDDDDDDDDEDDEDDEDDDDDDEDEDDDDDEDEDDDDDDEDDDENDDDCGLASHFSHCCLVGPLWPFPCFQPSGAGIWLLCGGSASTVVASG